MYQYVSIRQVWKMMLLGLVLTGYFGRVWFGLSLSDFSLAKVVWLDNIEDLHRTV